MAQYRVLSVRVQPRSLCCNKLELSRPAEGYFAINRSEAHQGCHPTCCVFEWHKSTQLQSITHTTINYTEAQSNSSVHTGSAHHCLRVRRQLLTPATVIHVDYCDFPCDKG